MILAKSVTGNGSLSFGPFPAGTVILRLEAAGLMLQFVQAPFISITVGTERVADSCLPAFRLLNVNMPAGGMISADVVQAPGDVTSLAISPHYPHAKGS